MLGCVHLVPVERRSRHMLEDERVCEAIGALGDRAEIDGWVQRFGLLADRSRLTLMVCIAAAGPISVTDLAVAADMNETTVSQALRLLRTAGAVAANRDGRIVRYELVDPDIAHLIERLGRDRPQRAHAHR
jgi:ArsR family transcriptional regulator, lead/cadmium/zinc/bismuth-responsive transcriptional repressor